MLIVNVKHNNIERALKMMRRKVITTKQLPKLKDNRYYRKPSLVRREELLKAKYKQKKAEEQD
tara:strand:+ start:1773 stop:1961 length:189 start_codon:yes stop_codon:yes gene_type:complete